jgi:hypothetical protein
MKYRHFSGGSDFVKGFSTMKRTINLVLIFTFCGVLGARSQIRYDAKTWRNVQTLDVQTLSKSMSSRVRQLVGIKCNFRGKDIHHMQPNWYESSIWAPSADKNGKFTDVRVMVAKKDLDAFKSLPIDSSGPEMTLYGRVERDVGANFFFVRLVGRNATVDSSGNAVVTW